MKKLILAVGLFLPCAAGAQTFVNYTITNFTNSDGKAFGQNQIIFDIPTNTTMTIVALRATDGARVDAQFPQSTNQLSIADLESGLIPPQTVLGPAKIFFVADGLVAGNDICVLTVEFQAVNAVPDLAGLAVQPNGRVATVALETSADLKTWQTATNGTYPATNAAAFYRINFQVN